MGDLVLVARQLQPADRSWKFGCVLLGVVAIIATLGVSGLIGLLVTLI